MSVICNLSFPCGMALAILLATCCQYPELLMQFCSRQPCLRKMGLFHEFDQAERDRTLRVQAMAGRLKWKAEVARDVIHGRRTLVEAAASIRAINRRYPAPPFVRQANDMEDLYLCRQVIAWVKDECRQCNRDEVDNLLCKLETELQERFNYCGEIEFGPVRAGKFSAR